MYSEQQSPPPKPPKPINFRKKLTSKKQQSPPPKPPKPYKQFKKEFIYQTEQSLKSSHLQNRLDKENAKKKENKRREIKNTWIRNGLRLDEIQNKKHRTQKRKLIGNQIKEKYRIKEKFPSYEVINNPYIIKNTSIKSNNNTLINEYEQIDNPLEEEDFIFIDPVHKKKNIFSRFRSKGRKSPRKRGSIGGGRLNILEMKSLHKKRSSPIYRGLGNDMLMAYIYLIIKHNKSLCIAIGNKEKLKRDFNPNYIGLSYELGSGKTNKLVYDGGLKTLSKFINSCKNRFFIIPLSMEYPTSGAHFNLLIGDNENNIIERFEPYGSVINEKVHTQFDKEFQTFLKKQKLDFTYIKPEEFIKKNSFQELEEKQIDQEIGSIRKDDYRGYCGMWSVWFIDLKMNNPNLSSKKLLDDSLKKMKGKNFRRFIRNYTNHIIEVRKMVLEGTDKECKSSIEGKSPNYSLFKHCVNKFVRNNLDKYF